MTVNLEGLQVWNEQSVLIEDIPNNYPQNVASVAQFYWSELN